MLRSFVIGSLLCLSLLALSNCAPIFKGTSGCENFSPIYISKDDILTDGTAREILAHDLAGQKLCDWTNASRG